MTGQMKELIYSVSIPDRKMPGDVIEGINRLPPEIRLQPVIIRFTSADTK